MKKETKQKPRFRTNYNGYVSDADKEVIDPISITIPNETYSLRDIVERFSKEYPSHLMRTGYYDEIDEANPDWDDFDPTRSADFDLVDAHELKEKISSKKKKSLNIFKQNGSDDLIKSSSEPIEKTEEKGPLKVTDKPDSV